MLDYSREFVFSLHHVMTQSLISTEESAFETNNLGELVLCCLTEWPHSVHCLRGDANEQYGAHQGCHQMATC